MKKFLALVLSMLMVVSLCACGESGSNSDGKTVKAGFIFLHDENSTYDLNFINAAKEACDKLGVEYVLKTNVAEGEDCYNAAVELVEAGCNIIFADSFGHEDYMIKAAKEFTDVQFCHATGTKAHTQGLDNYHNAFASIYQGRYLAGVAAGLKLQEMLNAGTITEDQLKIGYVGAYTYAEVMSGYTSFFLGVRSVVPSVTMEVTFTGSWYDETAEKEALRSLSMMAAYLFPSTLTQWALLQHVKMQAFPTFPTTVLPSPHAPTPLSYLHVSTGLLTLNMLSRA